MLLKNAPDLLGLLQDVSEKAEEIRSQISDGYLEHYPNAPLSGSLKQLFIELDQYETDHRVAFDNRDPGPSQAQRL